MKPKFHVGQIVKIKGVKEIYLGISLRKITAIDQYIKHRILYPCISVTNDEYLAPRFEDELEALETPTEIFLDIIKE